MRLSENNSRSSAAVAAASSAVSRTSGPATRLRPRKRRPGAEPAAELGAELGAELAAELGAEPGSEPGSELGAELAEVGTSDRVSGAADAVLLVLAVKPADAGDYKIEVWGVRRTRQLHWFDGSADGGNPGPGLHFRQRSGGVSGQCRRFRVS